VQIELKKQDISPRKAMQQIVDYKNEAGNGYGNSLLCYMQLFIVSNRTNTYYFANNKNQHFAFNADEQFLPIYQLVLSFCRTNIKTDNFGSNIRSIQRPVSFLENLFHQLVWSEVHFEI